MDISLTLALFLVVAPHARDLLGTVQEATIDEQFIYERIFLVETDGSLDRMKGIAIAEKSISEKISREEIDDWDEQ